MSRETCASRIMMNIFLNHVSQALPTRIRIRLYPQTFCCGSGFRTHVSGENAHCNRKLLLKTLSSVETFENATNPVTCGRVKFCKSNKMFADTNESVSV